MRARQLVGTVAVCAGLLLYVSAPRWAGAEWPPQDRRWARPDSSQDAPLRRLLEQFHLEGVQAMLDKLGVERANQRELLVRRDFWGERFRLRFRKMMPVERKAEEWSLEYEIDPKLLLRGEWARSGGGEEGTVDLLFRHEY